VNRDEIRIDSLATAEGSVTGDERSRLHLLADASAILASSLDYHHTIDRLARLVVPVLGDWCAVDILSEDGRLERISVQHSDPAKVALAHRLHERYPPDLSAPRGVGKVLRTGQAEWAPEIPDQLLVESARDEEHLALARALGLRSYVAVPLIAGGRPFGVLTLVQAESGRRYGEDDLRFASEVASRAAAAIEHARLFTLQKRLTRQALLVGEVGASLTRSTDLPATLQCCTEAMVRHLDAAFARIWTLDHSGQMLELQASAGMYTHLDGGHARVPVGAFKIGLIAAEHEPHLTNDVVNDPRVSDKDWARREGMVAFAGYPLELGGRVVGVMALFARHPLDDDTLDSLAAVADSIAVGIERGRAEDARRRAEAEREAVIASLARSNRELEQFAYVTSHDLRAPLRGIASLAEWIEEDLDARMTPDSREHLQQLRGRVERLEALITGILDYSRAGRDRHAPEHVDLAELVAEVTELLAPPPGVRIVAAPGLPSLSTEKTPLQQVFLNLIGNAIKYAGRADARIDIDAADRGPRWQLSVRDNGAGIDPRFHERIWGIFQTLAPRDKVEATGVGLSVVRKIVESKGGGAWVESRPGEGATFSFTWPKQPPTKD
jgi:signal transduction histidine kinase